MNAKIYFLRSVVVSILIGSTTLVSAYAQKRTLELGSLRYEEVFTLGKESDDYFFGEITGVAIDKQNHVYVSDTRGHSLFAFDNEGAFLWSNSEKGNGPGELSSPRQIAVADGKLYVSNQSGTRLEIFSTDGEYLDVISSDEIGANRFSIRGIVGSESLVLSTSLPSGGFGIRVLFYSLATKQVSPPETIVQSTDEDRVPRNIRLVPPTGVHRNLISLAHAYDNSFTIMDASLDTVFSVDKDDRTYIPHIMANNDGSPSFRPTSEVNAPLLLNDQFWISDLTWPEIDSRDHFLQLMEVRSGIPTIRTIRKYDLEGNLIETIFDGPPESTPYKKLRTFDHSNRIAVEFSEDGTSVTIMALSR